MAAEWSENFADLLALEDPIRIDIERVDDTTRRITIEGVNAMNILAVDTAGKTAGVALLQDDRLLYECYLDAGMTHSETLMPLIDNCLKFCGTDLRGHRPLRRQCRPRQLYRAAHRAGRRQGAGLPSGDALRAGLHPGSAGGCPHG